MNSEVDEHVEVFNNGYKEQSEKFWSIYASEAEQYDVNITETWKANMESMLIFAGLFSAVVTAFIIESYRLLKQDPANLTTALLTQILAVQIVIASPLNNPSIPAMPTNMPSTTFVPSASAIAVNFLWFFSLVCSLAAAFCVILVQQWVRNYLQRVQRNSQPLRRARDRTFLFNGVQKYRMELLVENIPILLHTSLFLFFIGLCVYLFSTLTLPNVAVTGAVVPPLLFCLVIYGLATISPLLDPSSPFETPFSSILWKVQQRTTRLRKYYLGTWHIPASASVNLTTAREQLALNPLDRHDSHSRDAQAFLWSYRRVNDDNELQRLIECIPGFLESGDGRTAWGLISEHSENSRDDLEELEPKIQHLMFMTSEAEYMEPMLKKQRGNACLEALYAISRYQPISLPLNAPSMNPYSFERLYLPTAIRNADSIAVTKIICTTSLMVRRKILTCWNTVQFPKNLRKLSEKADQALKDVQRMHQTLEDVLKVLPTTRSWDVTDIGELLEVYFAVLRTKSLDILEYINVIRNALASVPFDESHILSWYYYLPRNPCVVEYPNPIPNLGASREIHLYPHQILAFLRYADALPPLEDMPHSTLPSMRLANDWFPNTHDIVRRFFEPNEALNLCREIEPISLLLDQLVDASFMAHPKLKLDGGPFNDCLPKLPRTPLLSRGPFITLTYAMEDIQQGDGKVFILLEILSRLYQREAEVLEPSVIHDTIEGVLGSKKWTNVYLSEGSRVLLNLLLHDILAWERGHSTRSTPFFLSRYDVSHLIKWLKALNLTHYSELSLRTAEQLFGLTPIDSASRRTRARAITKHIMQRRAQDRARPVGDTIEEPQSRLWNSRPL